MISATVCGHVAERRHLPMPSRPAMGSEKWLARAGRSRSATTHLALRRRRPAAEHLLTDVVVAPANPAARWAGKSPVGAIRAG